MSTLDTGSARLTSRHLGWRGATKNLSQLVKSRSAKRSMRRYRSLPFRQLNTARTAGTAIVSTVSPFGNKRRIVFRLELTQSIVVRECLCEWHRDQVKSGIGGILVKKSTGFPTTRTSAATSPDRSFCSALCWSIKTCSTCTPRRWKTIVPVRLDPLPAGPKFTFLPRRSSSERISVFARIWSSAIGRRRSSEPYSVGSAFSVLSGSTRTHRTG